MVLAAVLAATSALTPMARATSIWIEGEAAAEKDVTKHGWYDGVKKEGMSGGDWLSHYDGAKPGTASYRFEAPEAGKFTFWWRGNPFAAKVSYALNGEAPVEIDFAEKRGEYMISDKPDHRFLAWIKVGQVELKAGANTIAFKIHGEINNSGGIDCFLFDNTGFVPSGALKPATGAAGDESPAGADEAIWIEGEKPSAADVSKHGWYDGVKKEGMSGGDWLSHYDGAKPGTATYEFDVAKADQYTFWWRGNPFAAKVGYKLNAADWQEIDFAEKRGEYMISEKPDHRFLAWIRVGKVTLPAGKNSITFKIHGEIANSGGIDCFCFTRVPFVPSGANRPASSQPGSAAPDQWFPVVLDADSFSPDSVIDMSKYIEAPAGEHGFLKRDGDGLRLGKERGVQFWGCGANLQGTQFTREQLTQRIRYLRKHGINMVRQHPVADELGQLVDGKFDEKRLDAWDWWCAELKKHGIYMTWSVFYGQRIGPADGYPAELFAELDQVDAQHNLRNTYGLVNVERPLQDLQLAYLKALLLHKNPYTGLRPVDDPGLAVLEFQNEDCIFFHFPLGDLPGGKKWPQHTKRLRQKFFEWTKKKYRTPEAVQNAWGQPHGGDAWDRGELELMAAWQLGEKGPGAGFEGQTARAGDYIHFLTDLQRGFYERREREIRELGYKAVTVTTAWRAGGPASDPANLYCDTAADMIDRHNYTGGGSGGHGIGLGEIHNETHLTQPGSGILSIGLYQVADRPFSCTEWTQLPPNQWKLEAAPLVAFYGLGLQGWDASYHFLNSRSYVGDGWPGLSSYVTDTPHYIGQFPALFFAIHQHHIKHAPPAAERHLKVAELYSGVDPLKQDFSGGGYDAKKVQGELVTPVEALAIGRVTVAFDGGKDKFANLNKYWNKSAKTGPFADRRAHLGLWPAAGHARIAQDAGHHRPRGRAERRAARSLGPGDDAVRLADSYATRRCAAGRLARHPDHGDGPRRPDQHPVQCRRQSAAGGRRATATDGAGPGHAQAQGSRAAAG